MRTLDIVVQFGEDVPAETQGPCLMAFEKHLRQSTGLDCRVFKDKMGDDSKLRIRMTTEERERI